jgi:two-component system cell cycle response regulator
MPRIMIVDDNEDFTNLYKASLGAAGFDTTIVNQSPVAIEMAYLVKPDVFLIDLMMPEIDGFQLCKMIRSDPVLNHIPIIIVTALTDAESKKAAMDTGANDYLTKPFHIDELNTMINALLQGVK